MKTKFLAITVLTLLIFACQTESEDVFLEESSFKEIAVKAPTYIDIGSTLQSISINNNGEGLLKSSETRKAALYMAEYITTGDSDEMGNTVFFMNVGNKQLAGDFAPDIYSDFSDGTNDISYYVDNNRPTSDMAVSVSNAAIDRAMATWEGVTCSELGMTELPNDGRPTGFISALFGLGGSFNYVSDVVHCGWHEPLFDAIWGPGSNILGVTFTIIWVDNNGNPIDLDNNGKYDVAWREIYYNDAFPWADDGMNHIDVETVALHEVGHGLSQGHFGKLFISNSNGKFHFAPRAVMNAGYTGIQTSIEKTDKAGHCSNWAEWPNN